MATFITLGSYTAQGIANVKESPNRVDQAREQLAKLGIQMKEFYLTMGEYDIVTIIEAPDQATAVKGLIAIGMQGNVSTTTMAALTEDEFREVVAGL